MLFQTQKRFFVEVFNKVAGVAVASKNPLDPAQHVTIKTIKDKNALILTLGRNDIQIKIELDKVDKLLSVGADGIYAIDALMIQKVFSTFDIDGEFTVNFVPSKMAKAEGTAEEIAALNKLGHFYWDMPTISKKKKEGWETVCADVVKELKDLVPQGSNTFEVSPADLSKFVSKISFAVGKDAGNPSFRNALIRIRGQRCEIVTANLNQLALGNFPVYNPSGDFAMAIPWEALSSICSILSLDPELRVKISYAKGNPGVAFLEQGIKYGDNDVKGRMFVKVGCSNDPFVNFDKIISQLDFRYSCKINKQQLGQVCSRLDTIKEQPRTETVIDSKEQTIEFTKRDEKGKLLFKCIPLDVTNVIGGDFGIVISSDFLKGAVAAAENNELELRFTGTKSLMSITPLIGDPANPDLVTYIQPFGPIPTATK